MKSPWSCSLRVLYSWRSSGNYVLRNARAQDAITIAQDLAAAVNNFKQRYHMYPGDFPLDPTTPEITDISPLCRTGAQSYNVFIYMVRDGALGVPAEVQCVPEILFAAGMVNKVDYDIVNGLRISVFKTKFGGRVWVRVVNTSNVVTILAVAVWSPYPASVTHVIEFEGLPCWAARDIDRLIDNDDLNTGKGAASVPACVGEDLVFYAIAL